MTASKTEDDVQMKMMKECVTIGPDAKEDITQKGQDTLKIVESLRQNKDRELRQDDDSKKDSRSSSSSSSFEIMKNSEIDENGKSQLKMEEEKKTETINVSKMKHKKTSSLVWDCGSTLYDSFELNSFKRQLDSAIASSARTMSMSHLPDRRVPPLNSPETLPIPIPLPPRTSSTSSGKKNSNKISRSLQRLIKSVFRPKQHQNLSTPSSPVYKSIGRGGDKDRFYVVYDKSGSLTTIPESTEKEEINSLVRKTVSERFSASRVVGISCA